MKICSKCKKEKNFIEFNKNKKSKDGHFSWCKLCVKAHYLLNRERLLLKSKNYQKNNREKVKAYKIKNQEKLQSYDKEYRIKNEVKIKQRLKRYRKENKQFLLERAKKYYIKFPWIRTLKNIKDRCNNINNKDYKNYGGRGIKCLIASEELKKLWFRDKAYLLKVPSIDREDNNGNYTFENCQYIEMIENNIKRGN